MSLQVKSVLYVPRKNILLAKINKNFQIWSLAQIIHCKSSPELGLRIQLFKNNLVTVHYILGVFGHKLFFDFDQIFLI